MSPRDRLRQLWTRLGLSSKLALVAVVIGLGGLAIGAAALNAAIGPAFARLEAAQVEAQVGRARAFLDASRTGVDSVLDDFAVWDAAYGFLESGGAADPAMQLGVDDFIHARMPGVAYVRYDGRVIYRRWVDLKRGADNDAMAIAFSDLARSMEVRTSALSNPRAMRFVRLNQTVLAIGVAEVRRIDGHGSTPGYVVIARELTAADASAALQTPVAITLATGPETRVRKASAWQVSTPIADTDGRIVGAMQFQVPRDASRLGLSIILSSIVISLVMLAATLAGLFLAARRLVVRRVVALERHMKGVTSWSELAPAPPDPSGDELGSLRAEFNTMIGHLGALSEQVQVQSFQLGLKESLATAMHRVTAILEPARAALAEVRSASTEGADDQSPIGRNLAKAEGAVAKALVTLGAQVQVTPSNVTLESVDLKAVIERNAGFIAFLRGGEVAMDLPATTLMVRTSRLLLSQVIGHLLTNAAESIDSAGRITAEIAETRDHGERVVKIAITDTGRGFDRAKGARLFDRGFTTKPGRTFGLGLPWCAETIANLGGVLEIRSEGPGKGARATILLVERSDEAASSAASGRGG